MDLAPQACIVEALITIGQGKSKRDGIGRLTPGSEIIGLCFLLVFLFCLLGRHQFPQHESRNMAPQSTAAIAPGSMPAAPRANILTQPMPQDGTVEVEDDTDSSFGGDYNS